MPSVEGLGGRRADEGGVERGPDGRGGEDVGGEEEEGRVDAVTLGELGWGDGRLGGGGRRGRRQCRLGRGLDGVERFCRVGLMGALDDGLEGWVGRALLNAHSGWVDGELPSMSLNTSGCNIRFAPRVGLASSDH